SRQSATAGNDAKGAGRGSSALGHFNISISSRRNLGADLSASELLPEWIAAFAGTTIWVGENMPREEAKAVLGRQWFPLSAIRSLRLADRSARIGADERDDVVDRADATEAVGRLVDAVAEGALGREQELIGTAQPLDIFAAEALALHADDVEPAQPCPIAHHLAVRDNVALDARHAADHRMPPD